MTGRVASPVAAGAWAVSDSRTRVAFTVGSLGRPARGSITCRWGGLEIGEEGAPLRVRAELDLDSLDTGIARRDADLRKPRFLDIDRHPTITWWADRFSRGEDGRWTARGTLSVRGTTAPLAVTGRPEPAAGGWLRIRACGVLDREAVGIRAPSFLVGRQVAIEIDAWLAPSPG